jgi:hypothetical protein
VRQQPKPATKKTQEVEATTEGASRSEKKGRQLKNLAFKWNNRNIMVQNADLGTKFDKLRERVVRENNLVGDIYFVFGSKNLNDSEFLFPYD